MRSNTFICFIIFSIITSCNNKYIDTQSLPFPDCTGTASNEFAKNDSNIYVIPDNPSNADEFERFMIAWLKSHPDVSLYRESDLKSEDLNKGLLIFGEIHDFNNWENFGLPIQKLNTGYRFKEKNYLNVLDGIFYLSEKRMVYTGNSLEAILKFSAGAPYLYSHILVEDGYLTEYRLNEDVLDMNKLRKSNFNKKHTRFFHLYVDKKLPKTATICDSIVIAICEWMELPLPVWKYKAFLHNSASSVRLFSNFIFLTGCDTIADDHNLNVFFVDEIHVNGLVPEMIIHETFHLLWKRTVGRAYQHFLAEGIVEYYLQLLDSTRVMRNFEVFFRHPGYDLENLIRRGSFHDFSLVAENNNIIAYNISGLFVKYLIDNWGMERFKRFYPMIERETAYQEIYGLTSDEIQQGFSKWTEEFKTVRIHSPKSDKERIHNLIIDANHYAKSVMKMDYKSQTELIKPEFINQYSYTEDLKDFYQRLITDGTKYTVVTNIPCDTCFHANTIFLQNGTHYAITTLTSLYPANSGFVTQKDKLLAESKDDGKSWRFIRLVDIVYFNAGRLYPKADFEIISRYL